MNRRFGRNIRVALSAVGSAILLFACDRPVAVESGNDEALMTEYSEHLSVIMTRNGRRSYFFKAPLVEGYTLAKEPYREFRKGVEITTYQDDSLTTVDAVLTANYAIYYENRELWEAKGDVVVVKSDGKTLYTQQLFWNAKTKRVYSNVDTKIVQNDSRNVFQGEGFESDEEFKEWRFRRFTGKMDVDVSQMEEDEADSLATVSPNAEPLQREESAAAKPSGSGRSVSPVQPTRGDAGGAESDTAPPERQEPPADTVGGTPVGAGAPMKDAGPRRATVPAPETVPAGAPHGE